MWTVQSSHSIKKGNRNRTYLAVVCSGCRTSKEVLKQSYKANGRCFMCQPKLSKSEHNQNYRDTHVVKPTVKAVESVAYNDVAVREFTQDELQMIKKFVPVKETIKTTVVNKKTRTIRFTDSENKSEPDYLVDYYRPMMTFTEIALVLNVPPHTVGKLYRDAIKHLEELLQLDMVVFEKDTTFRNYG